MSKINGHVPAIPYIPLRTLLGYPYLWKPPAINTFFTETWNLIKEGKNPKFRSKLTKESRKAFISNQRWDEIIGTIHWEIMNRDERGNPMSFTPFQYTSVVQLLRVIRNTYAHCNNYTVDERNQLDWFTPSGDRDDNKFASYWTRRFPLMLPFLWIKYYEFRQNSTLKGYYGMINERPDDFFILDANKFADHLNNSLKETLEKGALKMRFKYKHGSEEYSLEFRACNYLDKVLDKNTSVNIQVNDVMQVTHFNNKGNNNCEILTYAGIYHPSKNLNLIFSDSTIDHKIAEYFKSSKGGVIICWEDSKFTNDRIQLFVNKFSVANNNAQMDNFPLAFKHLSEYKQNLIIEHGQVYVRNKTYAIAQIMSNYKDHDTLDSISGCLLRQLLRNQIPSLFELYKLPECEDIYLEREVKFKGYVSPEILKKCSQDKFIISNTTLEKLCQWLSTEDIQEVNSSVVNFDPKFQFYLHNQISQSLKELIEKSSLRDFDGVVHHIYFVDDNRAKMQATESTPLYKSKLVNGENGFTEKVCCSGIEPLLIVAPTGWGKTQFLASIGKLLQTNSFVITLSMRAFVDMLNIQLEGRKCTKNDVKNIIRNIICENSLENVFLEEWLEQKCRTSIFLRIDLILDGFDEVPDRYQNLAKESIKVIQNDLPIIRLWVSSVENHLEESIFDTFFRCSISPLSETDQMKYFTRYIKDSKLTEEQITVRANKLKNLLDNVKGNLNVGIATTPLHCRILAEVFENTTDGTQTLENDHATLTIAKLYKMLIDKRLLFYIKEKENNQFSSDGISVPILIKSLVRLHKHLGLKLLLPQLTISKFREPEVMEDVKAEQYTKMGIVNKADPLTFIHNTFAEYLVAKFIFQVLLTGFSNVCSEKTFRELFEIVLLISFDKPSSHFSLAICYFLNEMLRDYVKCLKWVKMDKYEPSIFEQYPIKGFLNMTFRHKYWNITWLILNKWNYKKTDDFDCDVLKFAIHHSISKAMFTKLCQELNFNDRFMDLMRKNHYIIFQTALWENIEIAKHLVEIWFPSDSWSVIPKMNISGGGIMHIILDAWPRFYAYESDADEIKRKQNDRVELLEHIYRLDPLTIKHKDKQGRTPLSKIPRKDNPGDYITAKKFFLEQR